MSRSSGTFLSFLLIATLALAQTPLSPTANLSAQCVDCHSQTTPSVVAEWKKSKHGKLTCDTCHGADHKTAEDVKLAKTSTAACLQCHA